MRPNPRGASFGLPLVAVPAAEHSFSRWAGGFRFDTWPECKNVRRTYTPRNGGPKLKDHLSVRASLVVNQGCQSWAPQNAEVRLVGCWMDGRLAGWVEHHELPLRLMLYKRKPKSDPQRDKLRQDKQFVES